MRVLDRDEAGDRLVGVARVAEGGFDRVGVDRAVRTVVESADARPDDDGVARGFIDDEVVLAAGDGLLAAGEVGHLGDEVSLRSRADEQAGLLAEELGRTFLEGVDRRVVAEDVVAELGVGHGAAHGGRRKRDGVAAEVDQGHGASIGWGDRASRAGRRPRSGRGGPAIRPRAILRRTLGRPSPNPARSRLEQVVPSVDHGRLRMPWFRRRPESAKAHQMDGCQFDGGLRRDTRVPPRQAGPPLLCSAIVPLDPWCSGPTCQPVTLEIAGSNPVGSAINRIYLRPVRPPGRGVPCPRRIGRGAEPLADDDRCLHLAVDRAVVREGAGLRERLAERLARS